MSNNLDTLALSLCPSLDWDRDKYNWVEGFKAGVAAAGNNPDILQAILQPFAEWVRTFEALERQNGQWVIESQLSDEQIVKAFIADYKNKQDENSRQG